MVIRNRNKITIFRNSIISEFYLKDNQEARDVYKRALKVTTDEEYEEFMNSLNPYHNHPFLEKTGNQFHLRGVPVPLPETLKNTMLEYEEDEISIHSLETFWKLLATNPDKQVIKDLFDFADKYYFPITNHGYFIGYKKVRRNKVKVTNASKILEEYLNIVQRGESSERYYITYEEEDFNKDGLFGEFEVLKYSDKEINSFNKKGALGVIRYEDAVLYPLITAVQNIQYFVKTDEHFLDKHTGTMEIRLGVPVSMPRDECDNDPSQECSSGLHIGTPDYARTFRVTENDDAVIACLVNPYNVVAVPTSYGGGKLRCCEYYPFAVCSFDEEGKLNQIESKFFESDYLNYEKEKLNEEIKQLELASIHTDDDDLNELVDVIKTSELLKNRLTIRM